MIYCPFCDGQGIVYKARIKKTRMEIYICDECDTVWKDLKINENNCNNFENVMREFGKEALWTELENIEKVTLIVI